jgi:hypothetical protein
VFSLCSGVVNDLSWIDDKLLCGGATGRAFLYICNPENATAVDAAKEVYIHKANEVGLVRTLECLTSLYTNATNPFCVEEHVYSVRVNHDVACSVLFLIVCFVR